MLGYGAESIVHGLIGAIALTGVLRWRRDAPDIRLQGLAVALLLPTLLTPALRLLVPIRLTPAFRDGPALLSASHFLPWRMAGLVGLWALAVLGTLLFLRDLVPFLRGLLEENPGRPVAEGPAVQATERAAERLGVPAPPIIQVRHEGPVLMCQGWRPRVMISASLEQALTPAELEAALTHEVAHAARGDARLGWGLMLVRALGFWNPAVQLLGRQAVRELEHRADHVTVGLLGDSQALTSSLHRIDEMHTGAAPWLRALARREIEARSRALRNPVTRARQTWPLAFALGLAAILFLVVV